MGTRGVILIRTRKPKRKEMSVMGGPAGSQYFYEYYVCIYQHFDGYVKGGLGEWLANFLYEFTHNLSTYADTGLLATRLIEGLYSSNFFVNPRLVPIAPLEEMFHSDYDYVYIITVSCDSNLGLNDKSIMLSVCYYREFILTARPEKFLENDIFNKSEQIVNGLAKSFKKLVTLSPREERKSEREEEGRKKGKVERERGGEEEREREKGKERRNKGKEGEGEEGSER
ncbi:hypothetical protein RhiirB3_482785 [Rhizophagus irregularis]|nr:hypothetical protein RhiirB3_482785 [Rhizophagus irregularis]